MVGPSFLSLVQSLLSELVQVKAHGLDGLVTIASCLTWLVSRMAEELDARGLLCPEPLMLVRNAMRVLPAGEELVVVATDPSTLRDFKQFCRFMGHELVSHVHNDDEHHFVLRKGQG